MLWGRCFSHSWGWMEVQSYTLLILVPGTTLSFLSQAFKAATQSSNHGIFNLCKLCTYEWKCPPVTAHSNISHRLKHLSLSTKQCDTPHMPLSSTETLSVSHTVWNTLSVFISFWVLVKLCQITTKYGAQLSISYSKQSVFQSISLAEQVALYR